MNPNANYRTWVICCVSVGSPLLKKKKTCIILVSDVEDEGGYAYVGDGNLWGIPEESSQFCDEPKTAIKIVF